MALGATGSEEFAHRQGEITGQESRALGVHWIFAPVLDVNNNPDNPVINIRSFGEDPELVARLGTAFIRGAKSAGVLTTAKHFPGHGDTATDSHLDLAVVASDMARLQSVELAPFKSAIEAGVDSIMTAHVAVPKVTGEARVPATLSRKVLTELLREKLEFDGIVVTDALEMAGVTGSYWCGLAAIRAIQAGADALLLPPDAMVAINEVEKAVKLGAISEARIDQSVRKILLAKSTLGLHQNRTVSIGRIGDIVASPENTELAQDIADHSVTVVRDRQSLIPINALKDPRIFSLVLSPHLDNSPGSVFQAEMRRRFFNVRTAWANQRIPNALLSSIYRSAAACDVIVLSTSVRLASGVASKSLPQTQRRIIETLIGMRKPLIWVSFGNPYVLSVAPKVGTYICTFSYSDESQIAAAKALAGAIQISGRMPVSIPPYSTVGDGIEIEKFEMTLKRPTPEALKRARSAFSGTEQLLASYIESGLFPGAAIMVGREGRVVLDLAMGAAPDADSSHATSDNLYNGASVSNLVGIASAVMLATESRRLNLSTPIADYFPEKPQEMDGKQLVQALLRDLSETESHGAESSYLPADLLLDILFRVSGVPLNRFLAERLFEPLGMKQTFWGQPQDLGQGTTVGQAPSKDSLFTSTRDLAVFAQMLLNRGMYAHQRLLRSSTVASFVGPRGPWSRRADFNWAGKLAGSAAFGHFASDGSFLWIDPAKKLFAVFLTDGLTEDERIEGAQRSLVESIYGAKPWDIVESLN
jgi:beta-glucosidase-like glycosyl hydrolase/CubicO group peptidase (beta-lactamase class C family)